MPNSVVSGVNLSGSVSNLSSREENTTMMSSEGSSSYPDDSELELGLGLSLGGGGKAKPPPPAAAGKGCWGQYARILTAKDFPPAVPSEASSSSSSSSPLHKTNKRAAEPSAIGSQVAGWPPIGTYRLNSLVNHAKLSATGESASVLDKCITKNTMVDKTKYSYERCDNVEKEGRLVRKSLFVKVNMDGVSIGRKIDLSAHNCYNTLAHTLDHMFSISAAVGQRCPKVEEARTRRPALSVDGSSEFVLTYEDKEGDWMLVGDVPWEMFLSSVRRLRIRRTADANGLGPRSKIS
ncbi:hypothetical protein ACS0TY_025795 [Phlomoides rotata]